MRGHTADDVTPGTSVSRERDGGCRHALVARIWTYHARYDDVLVLIPMVALFRLAKQSAPARPDVAAGVMYALTLATMLVPARLLLPPWPWTTLVEAGQTVVWLGALAFLTGRGWPRPGAPPGAAG